MFDRSFLTSAMVIGLAFYLVIGLLVAVQRFARRSRGINPGGDPDMVQFFFEWLLWPAALLMDRRWS